MTRLDIKREEYYSPSVLMANNIFPWIQSTMTLMALIKSDKGKELFKPIVKTGPKSVRYYIKGKNVLKVLELADSGQLEI